MKGRTKRILSFTVAVVLLVVAPFAFREYRDWRELREERMLQALAIDSLEIRGATFDEALALVEQKVRSLGHPEVRLRIYKDGRECPYFREPTSSRLHLGASTLDLSVVSDGSEKKMNYHGWTATGEPTIVNGSYRQRQFTLRDVVREIESQFELPCAIRGDDLVAAHTYGTLHRYIKENIRLAQWAWDSRTDQELAELANDYVSSFYEGMTIKIRRDHRDVEFVGPDDLYELLNTAFEPHPGSRWHETQAAAQNWWFHMRIRFL